MSTAESVAIQHCWSCGASFSRKAVVGRFCSERCKQWYDAGNLPHHVHSAVPAGNRPWHAVAGPPPVRMPVKMKPTTAGFRIDCAGCGKEFERKGFRCCSQACERRYRERQDNLAAMAEAGMEPARKRQCIQCGAPIPKWRNKRAVSKAVRYCSPACGRKARKPTEQKRRAA